MTPHEQLVKDLTDLLTEAQRFEFHDFQNRINATPKIALVRRLNEIAVKAKTGTYDNAPSDDR